LAVKIMTI